MSDEDRQPCPECDGSWVMYWDEATKAPRVSHTDPACWYWIAVAAWSSVIAAAQRPLS